MSKSKPSLKSKSNTKASPHKLTKATLEFIIDKMSEGLALAKIHELYPDKCPPYNTVYKKAARDDTWSEALDKGYTLWYYAKQEELDKLSTGLASERYPGAEFREAEAALKRRIDALKFSLGKMAPIMSKRFDKATKVEVEGNVAPQLAVLNYYASDIIPSLIENKSLKDVN